MNNQDASYIKLKGTSLKINEPRPWGRRMNKSDYLKPGDLIHFKTLEGRVDNKLKIITFHNGRWHELDSVTGFYIMEEPKKKNFLYVTLQRNGKIKPIYTHMHDSRKKKRSQNDKATIILKYIKDIETGILVPLVDYRKYGPSNSRHHLIPWYSRKGAEKKASIQPKKPVILPLKPLPPKRHFQINKEASSFIEPLPPGTQYKPQFANNYSQRKRCEYRMPRRNHRFTKTQVIDLTDEPTNKKKRKLNNEDKRAIDDYFSESQLDKEEVKLLKELEEIKIRRLEQIKRRREVLKKLKKK